MLPYPQIKVQAGLYRYLQGPGVRLKESVVSNRVRLLHHRDWTCSSIVLLRSKAQLCNQQSPIKKPTSSYKFRWSPEAKGPGNRETDSVMLSVSTQIHTIIPSKSSMVNQGTDWEYTTKESLSG